VAERVGVGAEAGTQQAEQIEPQPRAQRQGESQASVPRFRAGRPARHVGQGCLDLAARHGQEGKRCGPRAAFPGNVGCAESLGGVVCLSRGTPSAFGDLDRAEQLVGGRAETRLLVRGEGKAEELLRRGEVLKVNRDECSGVQQRRGPV